MSEVSETAPAARVRFAANFDYTPDARTISFSAGDFPLDQVLAFFGATDRDDLVRLFAEHCVPAEIVEV